MKTKTLFQGPLSPKFKGSTLILGAGNTLKADDGFGSILAKSLRGKINAEVIEAGICPENYIEKIFKINPKNLIIVDAVDFKGKPGDIRWLRPSDISKNYFFATHNISLRLLMELIESKSSINVKFLAVQPKDLKLGSSLSKELDINLVKLQDWFSKIFPKKV